MPVVRHFFMWGDYSMYKSYVGIRLAGSSRVLFLTSQMLYGDFESILVKASHNYVIQLVKTTLVWN